MRAFYAQTSRGFTLVELLVAIAIVGLLMAVSVPGSIRMYESMQYRQAVRGVISTLAEARQQAVDRGGPGCGFRSGISSHSLRR